MEAIVYRKSFSQITLVGELLAVGNAAPAEDLQVSLLPEFFYPLVTEEERITWTHWLPASVVFEHTRVLPSEVFSMLSKLKAPPEVQKEFLWTQQMDLFNAYEVRTPVRSDAQSLLLGRIGTRWYRLALWGESLLPLEEITALVQKSLALRRRAFRLRVWLMPLSGMATIFSGRVLWYAEQPIDGITFLVFVVYGLSMVVFAFFIVQTQKTRQHNFLDRYRLIDE